MNKEKTQFFYNGSIDKTKFPQITLLRPSNQNARGLGGTGGHGTIGKDYFPNMNTKLNITVPFQQDHSLKASLTASGISDTDIPASFAWNNQALY